MNDLQALWETKQEEIEKLTTEIARLRAALADAEAEGEKFRAELAKRARMLKELTLACAEGQEKLCAELAEAVDSREAYRADARTARETAQTWAAKYEVCQSARAELAEQGAQLASVRADSGAARDEVQRLRTDNNQLVDRTISVRAELAAEIKRAVRLAAALAKSEAELAACQAEVATLRAEQVEGTDTDAFLETLGHVGAVRKVEAELAAALGERDRYRAALLQVRVWTSTPKGLTDRKAQLAAIKHITDDALAPPPPAGEAT